MLHQIYGDNVMLEAGLNNDNPIWPLLLDERTDQWGPYYQIKAIHVYPISIKINKDTTYLIIIP